MSDTTTKETIKLEKKGDSVAIASSRGEKFRGFIDRWVFGNYGQRKPIIGAVLAAAGGLASGGAINAVAAGGLAALYSSIFEVRRGKRLAAVTKEDLHNTNNANHVVPGRSPDSQKVNTPGNVISFTGSTNTGSNNLAA